MITEYLFSSPQGDISLTPEDLSRPFLVAPLKEHPFLTLRDYFHAIEEFILKDGGKSLGSALKKIRENCFRPTGIERMVIRSEKHGAFHHVASVEIFLHEERIKFAVNTALSEEGRERLAREFGLLRSLNDSLKLPYLPEVHQMGEVIQRAESGEVEILAMLLGEWFEDYHEWHFSVDGGRGHQKLCIWDLLDGHRFATLEEAYQIFHEASKIVTLYYDTETSRQIYPWHHGAGDFVVSAGEGRITLRLTTVRGYRSMMDRLADDPPGPMTALLYFFLNLTLRMRLDRLDGVGKTVWADDFAAAAATEGFFQALGIMEAQGRIESGLAGKLLSLLQSFSEEEFGKLLEPLLVLYQEDDPTDLAVILANRKRHVTLLSRVLQALQI